MNLPAYEPSKHKDLRAQRVCDITGTHPDMMYCEFKGCTIMVYGKVLQPPIGSNRFPGWEAMPDQLDLIQMPKLRVRARAGVGLDQVHLDQPPNLKARAGARVGARVKSRTEMMHNQGKTRPRILTHQGPTLYHNPGRIRTMRTSRLSRKPVCTCLTK